MLRQTKRLPDRLYHLTDAANWFSIERYGLLSAWRLFERAGICGEERAVVERRQRTEQLILRDGSVINDQRPMEQGALAKCLVGMTPEQWYELLNGKVFFWFDAERLNRMRRVVVDAAKVVMVVDTARLLKRYAAKAMVTPINTGNARRAAATRGLATFVPYERWLESGWLSEAQGLRTKLRLSSHQPVELTIDGAIPDIMDFVLEVQWLNGGDLLSAL